MDLGDIEVKYGTRCVDGGKKEEFVEVTFKTALSENGARRDVAVEMTSEQFKAFTNDLVRLDAELK
ncbi:hypothetical protein J8273_0167 [Carpediemonas membranifera]|uniref:COMM domain-containing protein n=1 Tax=Carpediemonas membranifera TaxID=201153 RepID=A0A8J6E0D4_9EUKA|nr:hypothetical protein J8273_0167 [Carpediemonas membranifera]|eukprot:KAG9394959.1 hypothetical protein J8273_0167 [Carpediemonas membranifera]